MQSVNSCHPPVAGGLLSIVATTLIAIPTCVGAEARLATVRLSSPQGENEIVLTVFPDTLQYEVIRNQRVIIGPSLIRPRFRHRSLANQLVSVRVEQGKVDRSLPLLWGKSKVANDRYRWAQVKLQSISEPESIVQIRAYDDGVAWRYIIPSPQADTEVVLTSEATQFAIARTPHVFCSRLSSFTTSHEVPFESHRFAQLPTDKLFDLPLLLVWADEAAAAITEAGVRGFAGAYLQKSSPETATFETRLSPLPDDSTVCVRSSAPLVSPWRVVLLADRAGELLESNLLLCLNDPPQGDFGWVAPGKTTFPWWNGDFEKDYLRPAEDRAFLRRNQSYVDFCAKHRIAYHAVAGDGRPWYVQTGGSYGSPTTDADPRKPRPEIELHEIIAYGREHGVAIRLWVHWKPLQKHLREALSLYADWGIKGLMVDFLDRDDQEMNQFTEQLLDEAAKRKIHIQIHGSPKYSGEQRTFPHLLNREGVLNLEYLKWSHLCTPQHNVNVAYLRGLVGPIDYHLGGFRSVPAGDFEPRDYHPFVLGTRCHHLALYVVYENPMPMIADTPTAYLNQPGFEFLCKVPTTWDETKFIMGELGEFLVIARRKGKRWYVGGITNQKPRKLILPATWLLTGEYQVMLYQDRQGLADRPNEVAVSRQTIGRRDKLEINMSANGGCVAIFTPTERRAPTE